jgi:ATP-dependent protease HslVU (ClpYQ) peptidase subunit|tara:strand:- start:143 stop:370 length:228 start_codon:yes stop_codon:yes gene_type:complete
MKGQKQSRVDGLEKKVEALIRVVQKLIHENENLKQLAFGTLETVKLMPDYDKALEDLKKKTLEQAKEKDKDEEMD